MGQKNSVTFYGVGSTPAKSCQALQQDLNARADPDAFVGITEAIPMSPRAVPHQALAKVKGCDYAVTLTKLESGFKASLTIKKHAITPETKS